MMIQRFAVATLMVAIGATAHAQTFNKDALKEMQQQGHDIVEQAGARRFQGPSNLCLDSVDNALVVTTCSEAETQVWRIDEQKHLVAHTEQCVAGAVLAECGTGNPQIWTYDEKKRLANANLRCLQIEGTAPIAGAKVVTAPCSDAANQIWQ